MLKVIRSKDGVREFIRELGARKESENQNAGDAAAAIIADVRGRGDTALRELSERFDGVRLESFRLDEAEIDRAYAMAPARIVAVLERAATNIRSFHERQKRQGFITAEDGAVKGVLVRPMKRVGLYVPGGTAAYPSSLLMNAIPAQVAGVRDIMMCTPPGADGRVKDPVILAAAKICGIKEIYRVGGAQAVAAMAYGTDSIPRVDKIVGPGNIYVALAKKLVYGDVDIDMVAGPSEVLVIADGRANARYIAADLMSQAEHGPQSSCILVCDEERLAREVIAELERQIKAMPRADIIRQALESFGAAIIVDSMDEALAASNEIAPEHLEILTENPMHLLDRVENAGSVFLGEWSPEPLGDYMAGPNHVLPTSGTARFASPLSVDDFIKKSSFINYSQGAFKSIAQDTAEFARAEGLYAHANSVEVRI